MKKSVSDSSSKLGPTSPPPHPNSGGGVVGKFLLDKASLVRVGIAIFIWTTSVLPESTNTTLSDPAHLQTFNEVTSKIRCICLPSLPIKSCSFNNCRVSAYLKQFFENRIRKGENSETIIAKTQNGFGDEIFSDPTVQKFLKEGNEDIVNGLVRGFGPRILADPDPTQINFTLLFFIISGLILIFVYLKKIRQKKDQQQVPVDDQAKESLRNEYIRELDEK